MIINVENKAINKILEKETEGRRELIVEVALRMFYEAQSKLNFDLCTSDIRIWIRPAMATRQAIIEK